MEKKKVILKFFGFLVLFIVVFLPGYSKFQELAQRNKMLEDKIQRLELSNKQLEEEIKRLEDDPAYVEKIAREKLKITRKGEIIYKIVEGDEEKEPQKR